MSDTESPSGPTNRRIFRKTGSQKNPNPSTIPPPPILTAHEQSLLTELQQEQKLLDKSEKLILEQIEQLKREEWVLISALENIKRQMVQNDNEAEEGDYMDDNGHFIVDQDMLAVQSLFGLDSFEQIGASPFQFEDEDDASVVESASESMVNPTVTVIQEDVETAQELRRRLERRKGKQPVR